MATSGRGRRKLPANVTSRSAGVARARRRVVDWFAEQGWSPFRFQRQMWNAYLDGQSGLLHATTGTGKTYAAWMGPLIESLAIDEPHQAPPHRVLWITPLRALATDTLQALERPLRDLSLSWTLESRTGDTSQAIRRRQRERLPSCLVTTPESVSLLLTRSDAAEQFRHLKLVIVDEWHELLSTKRGVQVELALARLRRWCPELRVWGLSATLGNVDVAMKVLLGVQEPAGSQGTQGLLLKGGGPKPIVIDSVIPRQVGRFPWAGHLGLAQLDSVVRELDRVASALVFTNTRFQAEQWYQSILAERPEWAGQIALHHGSLDRRARSWVEDQLRDGGLRCVVCTSSLDLGVDFSPVERVFQVGSPKGVARLLQRAGRSGHQPGARSRVTCVPTHAFELIEAAAARDAVIAGQIEAREPLSLPLDVLAQHIVTIALGQGFTEGDLLEEVRSTACFDALPRDAWQWLLDFVTFGGETLRAYPDYRRVDIVDGVYRVTSRRVAQRHRMSIGTIVSDAALTVQFLKGPRLGTIEESFVSRLRPGDLFTFAGRSLELVKVHEMRVYVRRAKGAGGPIPRWMGGRMPLSTELATAVRRKLDEAVEGRFAGPEMEAVRPLLELQMRWSRLPRTDELLIECVETREGAHLFLFPFAGRLVHEGLAALLAYRLARERPLTFAMSVNDYGIELLSASPVSIEAMLAEGLLSPESLEEDILASLNAAELAKRQFREIARIAGLVFDGYPGSRKTARQVQASSGLLYDVFTNYDPSSLLLDQARREVLERQLEVRRLRETLERLSREQVIVMRPARPTPLAFPLLVDRLRERVSSETLLARVERMRIRFEKLADTGS